MLHIVDLDGAFSGEPKNLAIAQNIAANAGVPVQFGGGVRTIAAIKKILDSGVSRVILGTKAIEDKKFLQEAHKKFKDKIIISLDAKAGNIMVRGWQAAHKKIDLFSFAAALKEMGFKEVIYTDTTKDGTLTGPNIKGIKELLKKSGLKVIASGGISSLDDIARLKILKKQGVSGIIIGKALYEGKFTLTQALKI